MCGYGVFSNAPLQICITINYYCDTGIESIGDTGSSADYYCVLYIVDLFDLSIR